MNLSPLSGRVPVPVERHEAESSAGEYPQTWEANIMALRLATVTRPPEPPKWHVPTLEIVK